MREQLQLTLRVVGPLGLEPVHDLIQTVQTPRMREKNYPSDVSRERFEQIRPILEQART
ncbi:hypothetical protein [Xanthomonas oryzae]|uniref:hypothetical protein n=1 Tax=Xanthomonas oryzae TaxID=347 RepID=UPI00223F63E3|nr:hypothetical protein DXO174_021105 [Xanthomonas oryzae pv. oryzae]